MKNTNTNKLLDLMNNTLTHLQTTDTTCWSTQLLQHPDR